MLESQAKPPHQPNCVEPFETLNARQKIKLSLGAQAWSSAFKLSLQAQPSASACKLNLQASGACEICLRDQLPNSTFELSLGTQLSSAAFERTLSSLAFEPNLRAQSSRSTFQRSLQARRPIRLLKVTNFRAETFLQDEYLQNKTNQASYLAILNELNLVERKGMCD